MQPVIRAYRQNDFEILCRWFDQYKWSHWDKDAISPYSYILEIDKTPLIFSSFYKFEGVGGGVLGFTIADRTFQNPDRSKLIDQLLTFILNKCREVGIQYLHYYTDSKQMVDRLSENHGFKITDNGDAFILLKTFGKDGNFLNE